MHISAIAFESTPSCSSSLSGVNTAAFNTNTTPSAPGGTASQSFCTGASPTVASLSASGSDIRWYSVSSGGSPLLTSTGLINNNHYFATQTESGCESFSRFEVTVTINTTPSAPSGSSSQTFCSGNNPV
ncbi:MAG: hypothetical protein NTU44_10515, partial [Bacteroidetes bacterium]|nr:hypothetical protein [Bacteroidota bacterium]